MRPNVLLVVLDAARRDAIEPYGAPAGTTPTIAELARRGSALPQAYATASWTLPSHASMFTGLLPRALGLGQPPGGKPENARPKLQLVADRLLAQVLHGSGYETLGFSTNAWASPTVGFDIGFDDFRYAPSDRVERVNQLLGAGRRGQLAWAREGLRSRSDAGAAEVGRALRGAIDSWSGQPTFWFVNLCECHSPYLPPRPWNDLGPTDRIFAALDAQRHLSFTAICLYAAGRHQIPDRSFARMRHLYRRAVSYMDDWLAGIFQALAARGILEETLVIVTADHGENFGEGGLIAHGFSVDQRLIHVPLVMAGPGAVDTDEVFSLAELPRLIAEATGLQDHPWTARELPAGVAVAQHDPMAGPSDPRVREFAERWQVDEHGVEQLTSRLTCVTDGRRKLVVRNGVERFFDLERDPGETAPLEPAIANGSAPLRVALEHPSVTATDDGAAEPGAPEAPSEEELAALEQQMKLLGYM